MMSVECKKENGKPRDWPCSCLFKSHLDLNLDSNLSFFYKLIIHHPSRGVSADESVLEDDPDGAAPILFGCSIPAGGSAVNDPDGTDMAGHCDCGGSGGVGKCV